MTLQIACSVNDKGCPLGNELYRWQYHVQLYKVYMLICQTYADTNAPTHIHNYALAPTKREREAVNCAQCLFTVGNITVQSTPFWITDCELMTIVDINLRLQIITIRLNLLHNRKIHRFYCSLLKCILANKNLRSSWRLNYVYLIVKLVTWK